MLSICTLAAAVNAVSLQNALLILFGILGVLAVVTIIYTIVTISSGKGSRLVLVCMWLATVIALTCALMCLGKFNDMTTPTLPTEPKPSEQVTTAPSEETTVPTTEETEPPTEPTPTLAPAHTSVSDPANWNVKWEIITQDGIVSEYNRESPIHFGNSFFHTRATCRTCHSGHLILCHFFTYFFYFIRIFFSLYIYVIFCP